MTIKKVLISFAAVCLFICGSNADKISEQWFGRYEIYIVYGEDATVYDEDGMEHYQPGHFIGYGIVISRDSCTFGGYGTQTGYNYLCTTRENGNELRLLYLKTIENSSYERDHSRLDTLATLIKDGQRYYIKSPEIADKNWTYNKKLLLNKNKKSN